MPKNVKCKQCFHLYNDWCKPKHDSPDPDIVRDCLHFKEKTNADRIRAMSDEELAKLMFDRLRCLECPVEREKCKNMYDACEGACLDWLQSPAGEVGDDAIP